MARIILPEGQPFLHANRTTELALKLPNVAQDAVWRLRFLGPALVPAAIVRDAAGRYVAHVFMPAAGSYRVELLLVHEGVRLRSSCMPEGPVTAHAVTQNNSLYHCYLSCSDKAGLRCAGKSLKRNVTATSPLWHGVLLADVGACKHACMDACKTSCDAPLLRNRRVRVEPSVVTVYGGTLLNGKSARPCVGVEALGAGSWWRPDVYLNASHLSDFRTLGALCVSCAGSHVLDRPWVWKPHICTIDFRATAMQRWQVEFHGNSVAREVAEAVRRRARELHLDVTLQWLRPSESFFTDGLNRTSWGTRYRLFVTSTCGGNGPTDLTIIPLSQLSFASCIRAADKLQLARGAGPLQSSPRPPIIIFHRVGISTPHTVTDRISRELGQFDGSRGWYAVDAMHARVSSLMENTLRHRQLLLPGSLNEEVMSAPVWDASVDGIHFANRGTAAGSTQWFLNSVADVLLASLGGLL